MQCSYKYSALSYSRISSIISNIFFKRSSAKIMTLRHKPYMEQGNVLLKEMKGLLFHPILQPPSLRPSRKYQTEKEVMLPSSINCL